MRLLLLFPLLTGLLAVGCSSPTPAADGSGSHPSTTSASPSPSPSPSVDPNAPTGWGPTEGELARARSLVAAMPVEQRAWQVLMPSFWGFRADKAGSAEAARNRDSHRADTIAEALATHEYGGLFIKPQSIEDAEQVAHLADGLHAEGDRPDGLPLLVSVDQEGGVVQRVKKGVTRLPPPKQIGRTGDAALARRIARDNAQEMRALGFTMLLAPVADVDRVGNKIVASRSFSTTYAGAAQMVTATLQGFLDAGVIPVVKHFPGHGSVEGDSHHSLPVQKKTVDQLLTSDLIPFKAAIDAGVPAVMTAHIAVNAVEPGMPASLSSGVIEGILRGRLGFKGVVVTDSQGMGPIYGHYGTAEGAVRSLLAGNDLVLNSPDVTVAHDAIVKAVKSGRIPAKRLDDAATRVVALRIYQQRIGATQPPMSVLRAPSHLADVAKAGQRG
ncbi:MAG: beta-N-acetylhexosaminidase [Actinomycetota bacterium]|jgi:beta-N-acetylhexosaminidase|nr:beta-N-acetylhexosaminidase [Actinomycetota bacterium]MDQ1642622.1 beta-N-acetylhexosaminidase [Actinomycetota bacterium]